MSGAGYSVNCGRLLGAPSTQTRGTHMASKTTRNSRSKVESHLTRHDQTPWPITVDQRIESLEARAAALEALEEVGETRLASIEHNAEKAEHRVDAMHDWMTEIEEKVA